MRRIEHIIDGETTAGSATGTGPVFNPATGEQTAEVVLGTPADVDAAVAAAARAAEEWAEWPPARRARVMFALRALIDNRRDHIARTISAEHGKTHEDALGEVTRALEVVEYACGIPELLKGDFSRNVARGLDTCSERQPLGVVAGITPFNFPFMVPLWMIPMALACGNGFVLKPSERDPSSANLIHELCTEAGVPQGLLNVVHGDRRAVDAILDHPGIAAISFVGSTPVAEYIYGRGSSAGKRVQALGGAKNHMIILPDADLDQAADGDLPLVDQQLDAGLLHLGAPEPKEARGRPAAADRLDQGRCMEFARGIPGANEDRAHSGSRLGIASTIRRAERRAARP